MYQIYMSSSNGIVEMPEDKHLGLIEACKRADLYKKRNAKNKFLVVSEEYGDIEYEV